MDGSRESWNEKIEILLRGRVIAITFILAFVNLVQNAHSPVNVRKSDFVFLLSAVNRAQIYKRLSNANLLLNGVRQFFFQLEQKFEVFD